MSGSSRVYIGLGSNLDDPPRQLRRARRALAALPSTTVTGMSPVYRSPPMGPADQPDYLNAVAALDTGLEPPELLRELQRIETEQGRVRRRHWGERSLDLDILLYGDRLIDLPELRVPHPGMGQRAFVLYPLADIAPGLDVPGMGPVTRLCDAVDGAGLRRIRDFSWSEQA